MLNQMGIHLLQGSEKDAWVKLAQEAASSITGTGNEFLGDPTYGISVSFAFCFSVPHLSSFHV